MIYLLLLGCYKALNSKYGTPVEIFWLFYFNFQLWDKLASELLLISIATTN